MADPLNKKYGPGNKNDKNIQFKTSSKPGSQDKFLSVGVTPNTTSHLDHQDTVTNEPSQYHKVLSITTKVALPVMLVIALLSIVVLLCLLFQKSPLRRWWTWYQTKSARRPRLLMQLPTVDITPVKVNHNPIYDYCDQDPGGADYSFDTMFGSPILELENGNVDSFLTPLRPRSRNFGFFSETPFDKLLLNLYEGTDSSDVAGSVSSIKSEGRISLSIVYNGIHKMLNVNILRGKFLKSKTKSPEETPEKNETKKRRKSLSPSLLISKLHLSTPYKTKNKKMKNASSDDSLDNPAESHLCSGKKPKIETMLQAEIVLHPSFPPYKYLSEHIFSSENIPFSRFPNFYEGGCTKILRDELPGRSVRVTIYEIDTFSRKVVLGETTLCLKDLLKVNKNIDIPELWRDLHLNNQDNQIMKKKGFIKTTMRFDRNEEGGKLVIAVPRAENLHMYQQEENSSGVASAIYMGVTILQNEGVAFVKYCKPMKNTFKPRFNDIFTFEMDEEKVKKLGRTCIVFTLFVQTSDYHRFSVGRCSVGSEGYSTGRAFNQWQAMINNPGACQIQWHDMY